MKNLENFDIDIYNVLNDELKRQKSNIELIASENFVSKNIMEVVGSCLTNKYAEGYPSKRYYGGCEVIDIAENLAIQRAKKLFNAEHVNVQPHSGAQANMSVYFAILEPNDTILGMDLFHGGHLTHGSKINVSGKLFNAIAYGVDKLTEMINYDEVRALAIQHKPKMIIAGASAYSREIDFEIFSNIAKEVGAYLMVDMAHIAGLVATGFHQNPVEYADFVTTTIHKTLRGPRGGMILCKEKYANLIDKAVFPGIQGGPLMHVIAGKAVCFKEALQPEFKTYIGQVVKNADILAKTLASNGFRIVSGGTDNHLILLDLRNINMTGKEAEAILSEISITCNKNTIPFDPESPFITSGIRLGSPAMTTRGMKEAEMIEIAEIITSALKNKGDLSKQRERVNDLVNKFPLY